MTERAITVHVEYFAALRERRGIARESIQTASATAGALYDELADRYGFRLDRSRTRVAVNDEVRPWESPLAEGDRVVFLTPFGGG